MLANQRTGRFPSQVQTGDAAYFLTKQEFDFVANETSFAQLQDEASRSLSLDPQRLMGEVDIFRQSVNRNPQTFQVPQDNGDRFFQKMNLALYLKNRTRNQQTAQDLTNIQAISNAAVDFIASNYPYNFTTKGPLSTATETKNALNSMPPSDLYAAVIRTFNAYSPGGGGRTNADPALAAIFPVGSLTARLPTAFTAGLLAGGGAGVDQLAKYHDIFKALNDKNEAVDGSEKDLPAIGGLKICSPKAEHHLLDDSDALPGAFDAGNILTYYLRAKQFVSINNGVGVYGAAAKHESDELVDAQGKLDASIRAVAPVAFAAGPWTGENYDTLKIYVMNVVNRGKKISGSEIWTNPAGTRLGTVAKPLTYVAQNDPNASYLMRMLFNIGARLQKDAFYRETNFKNVLEDCGMSMDQFAQLVENSVTTVYWPDCVANQLSLDEIRNLVTGLGINLPGSETMNKIELCSLILTSVGFRAEDFNDPNFRLTSRLGSENVKRLREIIKMMRESLNPPPAANPAAGYLGFGANLAGSEQKITEGAYVMTGYTANNVTMEKATRWLNATNVDPALRSGFETYARNQNLFDLMAEKKGAAKPYGMTMDFTRSSIEQRMDGGTSSVVISKQ